MKLPTKHPKPTILIDTREVLHYTFPGYPVKFASLPTADYSAVRLESVVAIERKELSDLLGCVGRDRQRAERYTARIIETPYRRHWRQLRTFAAVTEPDDLPNLPPDCPRQFLQTGTRSRTLRIAQKMTTPGRCASDRSKPS